ncbi:MAG: uroporphyrinogen decarboxylase family protein [Anaerolineae bacterium]|nr:uroporphyrinogen decarboxylase family protein [Anaerolineae bacterium]
MAEMSSVERMRSALRLETPDRVPVEPLFYHHPVRLAGISYRRYCTDPDAVVAAQVGAWKRYGHDAINIGTDVYVVAEAMGCAVAFYDDAAPTLARPALADTKDLRTLHVPDPHHDGRMPVVLEATRKAVEAVGDQVFIKARYNSTPFSLATRLRGIQRLLMDLYDDEQFVLDLLEFCVPVLLRYVKALVEQGAHAVVCSDSTANLMSREMYQKFAWPFERQVIGEIVRWGVPVFLHICGDTGRIVDLMAETGAACLEVDSQVDIGVYKQQVGHKVCLMGNLDTVGLLNWTPEQVLEASRTCIEKAKDGGGYILSAGCEVPPDTPPANIHAMVEAARRYGRYE